MRKILGTLFAASLAGCAQGPTSQEKAANDTQDFLQVYEQISSEQLKAYTKTLASDEFEGRAPTTPGEKVTLEYLTKEFKAMGFEPGNGDSYLQPVDLVQITAKPDMQVSIGQSELVYKENMVANTAREQTHVQVDNSDVVFVGFGVNAPEYGWNDYEGLDVKGKTVVILVNDPGFENPDSGKFQGKTMTYYGRWSYKYEEASRQGAAAAFIVHETAPASYGWSVVSNSWTGPQYGLVTANGNQDRVAVEGWISLEATQQIFAQAGHDFNQLKQKALQAPTALPLGIKASASIDSTIKRSKSHNVIATLPGSKTPDEHVIYTAHWDHLGKDDGLEGDQIYNGAHDNATGTATALAMASAYSKLQVKPERSVTFLIVTAEEQGLLGSKYYSEHPIFPLNKTVANINMDAMNLLGKTKDVSVVGFGKSELETYLTRAAKRQGRTLTQESRPEAGSYYRSDHFSFAKKGVPALYAKGGNTPINEAAAQYRKRASVLINGCYHQVCDQFRNSWDFSGMQEDAQMLFEVGYDIANSDDWPNWLASAEFKRQ